MEAACIVELLAFPLCIADREPSQAKPFGRLTISFASRMCELLHDGILAFALSNAAPSRDLVEEVKLSIVSRSWTFSRDV